MVLLLVVVMAADEEGLSFDEELLISAVKNTCEKKHSHSNQIRAALYCQHRCSAFVVCMLRPDSQPLTRFEAGRPVSNPVS